MPSTRPKPKLTDHLRPEVFRALGEPTRLAVIARLATADGPRGVTELSDCCGVHLSGVSRHLAILRRAGLVKAHRQGREVLYDLESERLSVLLRGLADALENCCGRTRR